MSLLLRISVIVLFTLSFSGLSLAGMPAPTAYWTMDAETVDFGGFQVVDDAGGFDAGIIGAGGTNPVGFEGEAYGFPGSDTDYLDMGNVLDPDNESYTVSLWFNVDSASGTQFLIGKGNHSSGAPGWSIWLSGETIYIRGFHTNGINDDRFGQHLPNAVQAGTWHHVAMVLDRESDPPTVRGYFDGTNTGWMTGGGGSVVDTLVLDSIIVTDASLLVGRRATDGAPFAGMIDELAIWQEALTPCQIVALARGLLPGTPDDETPPAQVTGLSALAEESRVLLDWDEITDQDAGCYLVQRSETAGGPFVTIAEIAETGQYIDNNVENGTTYHYVITAIDVHGNEGTPSSSIEATPEVGLDFTPPLAPTGLTASGLDGRIALSWNENTETDLAGYTVLRSTSEGGPYDTQVADSLSAAFYTDETVTNGTAYYYVVTASDQNDNVSPRSNEATATPEELNMPTPSAYWTFNENDIDDVFVLDRADEGPYEGQIVGDGITLDAGRVGQCLRFPGADTDYIDFGDVLDPGPDSYTVSLWFYFDAVPSAAAFLLSKGNPGSSNLGWSIWTENGTLCLRGQQAEGDLADRFGQYVSGLEANTWNHVALVLNRDSDPPVIRGYLNGSNENWQPGGGGAQTDLLIPESDISVPGTSLLAGRRSTDGAPAAVRIDEVAIWREALTPQQIAALSFGASPMPDPGDITAPTIPSDLDGYAEDSRVVLTWTGATEDDLLGYNVKRAEVSGGPYETVGTAVPETTFNDTTVVNGTTYFYIVTSIDTTGNESDPSGEFEGTPQEGVDLTPPAPPQGIVAIGLDASVALSWDANTEDDLEGYTIKRAETPGGPYTEVQTGISETEFIDTELANGTALYYVVTATDTSDNESDPSSETEALPEETPAIPQPTAYWTFDEMDVDMIDGSIFDWNEETPHEGLIIGAGVTNEIGYEGEALAFPGADTDYADFGDVLDPGLESYTVSLWFKTEAATGTQFIASKGNAFSAEAGWSIWLSDNAIQVRGHYDAGLDEQKFGQWKADAVTEGAWHHVAFVLDREADPQEFRCYLDGTDDSWMAGGGGSQTGSLTPDMSIDTTSPLFLGRRFTTGASFSGMIDDMAIWKTALSARQVASLAFGTPPWSSTTEEGLFKRGDTNADGGVNIADAVALLAYLFGGQTVPSCQDAADANDDGSLNIADAIAILSHLFSGTGDLNPPFSECGTDPTDDTLTCDSFLPCE